MKLRDLVEMAEAEPHLLDYTINLSQFMRIDMPAEEEGDEASVELEEPTTIVVDFPIRAVLSNDETQEIRFALYNEDFDKIEKADRTLREVGDDER
jgi:hypothetical protein